MFALLRKPKSPSPEEKALDNLLTKKGEEEQVLFLRSLANGNESAFAQLAAAVEAVQKT